MSNHLLKMFNNWVLIFILLQRAVEGINPRFAKNITVYHVNSYSKGTIPLDMDVSDIGGEIFFDLRSVVLPIECGSEYAWSGDCENSELESDDLVITKLELEVDTRFGEYGRCNVCNASGIDPFSGLHCTAGDYFCTCGGYYDSYACNSSAVGYENITETFSKFVCTWDEYITQPWRCWQNAVWQTTGGIWLSTPASGYCNSSHEYKDSSCTWRVLDQVKTISKNCSDAAIYATVQKYDNTGCFDQCSFRDRHNTSSSCFIGCFYKTVLGAEGMLPPYDDDSSSGGGLTKDQLIAAWDAPFSSTDPDLNGCPDYTPSVAFEDKLYHHQSARLASRRTRFLREATNNHKSYPY
mmetsp:Transcript_14092/g.21278  ORF Transcript_14092/g.21278 Transcript_14092/m.21278 type:complete len:352 (-) Transcript_14092:2167-3222(-)